MEHTKKLKFEIAAVASKKGDNNFQYGNLADVAEVEFVRVTATILVDYQGGGERAQFQQAMPIEIRASQPRDVQGKHCSHLTHRDIGY